MPDQPTLISTAFQTFMRESPQHTQAMSAASALAYLAVLAALRLENGIPFHVQAAKQAGATRDEVISAVLIGLPLAAYDAQ
jgi:alkylhydroperoxidase/carboxymuconolactone decarboxylase family protein YurZ